MTLQKRLTWLLVAFAAFSLVASFGTIYAIQVYVSSAAANFDRLMHRSHALEQLDVTVRNQCASLHEVITGLREAGPAFLQQSDQVFDNLARTAQFSQSARTGERLVQLSKALEKELAACIELVRTDQREAASLRLSGRINGELLPALQACLRDETTALDNRRRASVDAMVATNTEVLALSLVIGVTGAGLVAVGAALVRRWVILPIRDLQEAARAFGAGRLDYRVGMPAGDELGALGEAMNGMAGSLAHAEANLRASESKYRSLFENVRDAAVICDREGRIIECHASDSSVLSGDRDAALGRHLLAVWPEWRTADVDWSKLIEQVVETGQRVRLNDVQLGNGDGRHVPRVLDLIACPVELGGQACVAIILRDETERHRLEHEARRAEAMGATVNVARGVAHDFNNLLTSAAGSLRTLRGCLGDGESSARLERALRACEQAAGLSRKLLEFASGDPGNPQRICLHETVELILNSLDEALLDGIELVKRLDPDVYVDMDGDQLTQIVLNLIYNAREAMPRGGTLRISATRQPREEDAPTVDERGYALLVVEDTGSGIGQEVKDRMFEPFFTTKSTDAGHGRGMGLAIVYTAVRNAGGFVAVDSEVGRGATFRVYIPLAAGTN